MTLEEDILRKKVKIGAKRLEIEDLEVTIGIVNARDDLHTLLDELEALYRLYLRP
jgi:hypothetical protein